jgi:uncharacterized protein YyaL (SSP411 family)
VRYRQAAEAVVSRAMPLVERYPRAAGWAAALAEAMLAGPVEIAVVGPAADRAGLERTARQAVSPGAVVVAGDPDGAGVPLLADRPLVAGQPAAYVCRGFVCDAPVTDIAALQAVLARA